MLNTPNDEVYTGRGANRFAAHVMPVQDWDLERIVNVVKRQKSVILYSLAGFFGVSVLYSFVAQPQYTAAVDVLLDTPKVSAVADSYDKSGSTLGFETGGIDSQVEVFKSGRIALAVIKKLNLKSNTTFNPPPSFFSATIGGMKSGFSRLFGDGGVSSDATSEVDYVERAKFMSRLMQSLEVKRLGRTYVIELRYTSPNPALAAQVVNTYAEQYLVDQLDAKYDATTRAAIWLQDRIAELRERSLAADTKVQKYRTDHGLIAIDGKLTDEQALADANAQLSDARAKMADAEAKSHRIDAILSGGNVDAAVNESLANPVIAELRSKYLTASKREAEIARKLGPEHIAAANLRNEMKEYERLLFEELRRIGESYRSDFQIAKSRLENLDQNFKTMLGRTSVNNEELVHLRDLIRESDTYKALYETFLQRYQTAIQQQSFPINDARVITEGSPPVEASWPKKPLVLSLGMVLGLMTGFGLAFAREMRDRVFRTGEQVQDELGLEFLGLMPALQVQSHTPVRQAADPGLLGPISPLLTYALTSPLSGFAETLRATKVAADIALRAKAPKIIGIVSVMPSEGKTTVSKNFASLVANLGARTLLVDADLRNPGMSRNLAPYAVDGLAELITGKKSLQEVVLVEKDSGLMIVPAVVHRRTTNSSELLSSQAMRRLLASWGAAFDYIILDMPPIGPVIDVRAAADLVDAFVFVVEWGKTPRSLVRSTLEVEGEVREKCLGVLLNKVDQSKMKLYEGSEYRNYYYSKYSKYYTS